MTGINLEAGLDCLRSEFGEEQVKKAVERVKRFKVEVPSWVFGEVVGGRFV